MHLLGGISGLVACIVAGPRINRFKDVQFPFFFGNSRRKALERHNQKLHDQVKNLHELEEIKELVDEGKLS